MNTHIVVEKAKKLGELIKYYRERAGYNNQYTLSKVSNCSPIQISNYESGKTTPSKLVARELIDAMNLTREEGIEFIRLTDELRIERRKKAQE